MCFCKQLRRLPAHPAGHDVTISIGKATSRQRSRVPPEVFHVWDFPISSTVQHPSCTGVQRLQTAKGLNSTDGAPCIRRELSAHLPLYCQMQHDSWVQANTNHAQCNSNLEQHVDVLVHIVQIEPIVLHFPNVLRFSKLI